MDQLKKNISAVAILILVILVGGFYYYHKTTSEDNATNSQSSVDTSNWKIYSNAQYGFSFKYPVDSILFSEVKDNGTVIPPTDNEVCVSDGKIPPMKTDLNGNINNDPDTFCVSVYPNTTLDNYLKINNDTSLAQIDKYNSDDLGDMIYSRVKVRGATVALYAIDRMEVLMQKGRHLVVFSGAYFDYFSHLDRDPLTFSDLGFMQFVLSMTTDQ